MAKINLFWMILIAILGIAAIYYMGWVYGETKIYEIAVVYPGDVYSGAVDGFLDGLKEFGWVNGRNINISTLASGDLGKIKEFAVGAKFDLVYAVTTVTTQAVFEALGENVPIVFSVVGDPIGSGFVKSFSEPGGNITGCTNLSAPLSSKRLEIFKEAFGPRDKALRFVFLYNPKTSISQASLKVTKEILPLLGGVALEEAAITNDEELQKYLASLERGEYDGILPAPDGTILRNFDLIARRATELKLPIMAHENTLIPRGAMISYGAEFYDGGKQCGAIADKVLGGAAPSSLPVEPAAKFDLTVDLKKAAEINFKPDPVFLQTANKVVR